MFNIVRNILKFRKQGPVINNKGINPEYPGYSL